MFVYLYSTDSSLVGPWALLLEFWLFGTDPDRNRALEETPRSWTDSCHRKPLRRRRTLRNPAQTQVWSKQVWLDTTFISQGSRLWGKLAVETWRVKTELITITILHIIITTASILNLSFKTIAPKILAYTKCINKHWKYTQIFAATKSSKNIGACLKYQQIYKILALLENSGGISKYWRFMKIQAESQNIGASWKLAGIQNLSGKVRRNCKIHAPHNIRWNSGGRWNLRVWWKFLRRSKN